VNFASARWSQIVNIDKFVSILDNWT